MAGLLTRPSVRLTVATSPARVSRLCWELITSYPSACKVGMTLLKHEPSAQRPCTKTILGLVCVDIACSFLASDTVGRIPTPPRVTPPRVANPDSHGQIAHILQRAICPSITPLRRLPMSTRLATP